VRVGMKAKVKIASRADHVIPGRVVAVNLLPTSNWKEWDESLKHFLVRVRLDEKPASALPFMSATVEIDTGRVSNALVIPVEAMAVVDGQQSCYIVGDHGLERRAIKTRRATRDLLEITAGLQEGERVLSRSLDVDRLAIGGTIHQSSRAVARNQTASPRMSEASARSTPRSAGQPLSGSGNGSTS
jgi:multidrug efflux pump subunit AcrA (membrane-fusion protein)